jgi:hypothetical protein
MPTSNKKKIIAALAAVQAYITDEEAFLRAQAAAAPALAVKIPSTANNIWGLAGRQAGMQMRTLMQRRSFR